MSERLVLAAAKEPGRVLMRGNVGRDETLTDLPLVLPEGLLWDAEEYAVLQSSHDGRAPIFSFLLSLHLRSLLR